MNVDDTTEAMTTKKKVKSPFLLAFRNVNCGKFWKKRHKTVDTIRHRAVNSFEILIKLLINEPVRFANI